MPITFQCANPQCRARMTVPDNMAGKRGKCSKCKGPITVPGPSSNGDAAAEQPVATQAAKNGPSAPSRPAKMTPAAAPPPAPPPTAITASASPAAPPQEPVDVEAAAMQALADAPKEEDKQADFVEFTCPQCDEPIKMSLDLAGKRAPCPSCKRIIAVPVPQKKKEANWRDTGPKLPAGARKLDQPAPEGAWGSAQTTGPSIEALKEAGVIEEKRKPLTLMQRLQPYLLFGTPVLVLALGGLMTWNWWYRTREARAFAHAMSVADAPGKVGADVLVLLHSAAAQYQLRSDKPDCADRAAEQFSKAAELARAARGTARDALLAELAAAELALGGDREETDTGRKIDWRATQKVIGATLRRISGQAPCLEALRQVAGGLADHGHKERALSVVNNLYPTKGADRSEAMAVVGLELHRKGHKEEASTALKDALAPYSPPKEAKDAKKWAPPPLRGPVVALALVLGQKDVPQPSKTIDDQEADAAGRADGNARLGNVPEAQAAIEKSPQGGGGRVRAWIALACAAADTKQSEAASLISDAVKACQAGPKRHDLDFAHLSLISCGLRNGVPADTLEPVASCITDKELQAWGKLLLLRNRLANSRSVEPAEAVEAIPAKTLGGQAARLEWARHNAYHNRGSAGNLEGDEAVAALVSMGVALGMQGGK